MNLTPAQLDAQSIIKINYWIEFESDLCKELDDNYTLTKKIIKMLHETEPKYLETDSLGRLWGRGADGRHYPFHFEHHNQLVGYRLSKKAAN